MEQQIKSKQRVADHGEVFTAEREVNAMCDLVKDECNRIDSRFLEPACGDGNFLAQILTRKLKTVSKMNKTNFCFEKNSLIALASLYGIDILKDNVLACRDRLFKIWQKKYKSACKENFDNRVENAARFILNCNIICANALNFLTVDENQADTQIPIVFAEWTFFEGDSRVLRKDYTMDQLLLASGASEDGQGRIGCDENGEVQPQLMGKIEIDDYRDISSMQLPCEKYTFEAGDMTIKKAKKPKTKPLPKSRDEDQVKLEGFGV